MLLTSSPPRLAVVGTVRNALGACLILAGLGTVAAANPVFCDFPVECTDGVCQQSFERAVVFVKTPQSLELFWTPYEKPINLSQTSDPSQTKRMYAGDVPGFFFYTEADGAAVMSDRISAVSPRTDYKGHCAQRFD